MCFVNTNYKSSFICNFQSLLLPGLASLFFNNQFEITSKSLFSYLVFKASCCPYLQVCFFITSLKSLLRVCFIIQFSKPSNAENHLVCFIQIFKILTKVFYLILKTLTQRIGQCVFFLILFNYLETFFVFNFQSLLVPWNKQCVFLGIFQ